MINFRYHIVSLVAVFMALAIGIVLGATILGDRLNEGILTQAAADRKTVQEQRDELNQLRALDEYRDEYDQKVGQVAASGALMGEQVAIISMPDAPSGVIDDLSAAVSAAGGTVTRQVQVNASAFDPAKAGDIATVIDQFSGLAMAPADGTPATRLGWILARGMASQTMLDPDQLSLDIMTEMQKAKIVVDNGDEQAKLAQLVIVVTATADEKNRPTPELLSSHIQFDLALKQGSRGVVLAGPNSLDIQATDVATARAEAPARDLLSTVDVADLPSGVTSVVLALREQALGEQGHYGAQTAGRDDIAPEIPPR